MAQKHQSRKNPGKKRTLFTIIAISIIAAACLTILELTNTTYFFHKKPQPITAGQNTKGQVPTTHTPQQSTTQSSTEANPSTGESKSQNDTPTAATYLQPPIGNFVSAHEVHMNSPLTSVCNTTPGASCTIIFTMNGLKKQLATEDTDEGGSAYWNDWTPKDIGLSVGSWQIQAIATLGSQTKTVSDAKDLIIQ